MTTVRMPFESYTAQMGQNYTTSSSNSRRGHQMFKSTPTKTKCNRMNNFNDNDSHHTAFEFQPQIKTFSINQVDEDDHEDPEEKMHSPRTPYGSVPDPINNHPHGRHFSFHSQLSSHSSSAQMATIGLNTMQRTISASSFESVQSYSANSINCDHLYAPPLSATNSLTRSELKAAYSTEQSTPTSPGASPCATPKSYKLTLQKSIIDEQEEEDDDDDKSEPRQEEEKTFGFGEQNARNLPIEAIHKALTELKTKKQNGFVLYKQGLETYSACNSGANSTGTATPNSIRALSRTSSCGSVGGGSECCFDDIQVEGNEFDIAPINQTKLADFSEDEMETPVPTSTGDSDSKSSPFDFQQPLPMFDANAFGLAQISEEVEHQTMVTPNTNRTETESKSDESGERTHYDMIVDDDDDEGEEEDDEVEDEDDDEPVPQELSFEDEILLKGSRFQSSRVLFLDVDGVLLSTKEQAQLGRGKEIKFSDEVTSLMCKLYRETECDIVISSTWQFHTVSHLPYLVSYLEACGWRKNKIHTLLDLLPCQANDGINYGREWYEESPYCRCRARGIQKVVSLYGNFITRWCCLDDLPLHSQKAVCIPKKDDIARVVDQVSEAYFKTFTWRMSQKDTLMPGIKDSVKYALTALPGCVFSTQSYRFGYEYNQTMIYYQSDAIAKLCKLTNEIAKDHTIYQVILQNMMAVLNGYIGSNLVYQGDPYIAPYLIQTNQETGITPDNIENTITLLTYADNYRHHHHQLNDANRV